MADPRPLHVIVGLGNPGDEYINTRHNIGFAVLDAAAKKLGAEFRPKVRLTSAIADAKDAGGSWVLAKPMTFMNLSGAAVAEIMRVEGAARSQLLVVHDEADLELGRLQLRGGGSSGGHRGVASIIAALGNEEFARLRVGIGRHERAGEGLTGHVLGKFRKEEQEKVDEVIGRALETMESWWRDGLEKAMNQCNAKRGA